MLYGNISKAFHCGTILSSLVNTVDYLSSFYILNRFIYFYVAIHIYMFLKGSFHLFIQFKFIGKYKFMNVLNHGVDYMNTHLVI